VESSNTGEPISQLPFEIKKSHIWQLLVVFVPNCWGSLAYVTVATCRRLCCGYFKSVHAQAGSKGMINLPDGIVSVHLGNERYRGAYYFRGEKLVVTAYGMKESSADLEVLGGERGKAVVNLAKLVLIDMVRASQAIPDWHPELALCGTTTQIYY
jgi:hypothetical protein